MSDKNKAKYYWLTFGIWVIIVLILVGMIMFLKTGRTNYNRFATNNLRNFYSHLSSSSPLIPKITIKRQQTTLGLNDLNIIQSWMTFDYLNKAFNLPPDYLKTSLAINNPQYPLLTINHYSHLQATSTAEILSLVQKAIANYLQR